MKKLISLLAKLCVFFLVSGFSFLVIALIFGSIKSPDPESVLATVQVLFAFIAPILLGALVTWKIFKPEGMDSENDIQNSNAEIDYLLEKEESTMVILKEELSCWNWQLVVGGLIFGAGLFRIVPNFFLGIVLIVLGLGILSIGGTKYKEKQEIQERELRRKIYAAAAKESSPPIAQSKKKISEDNTKYRTYKVAGVNHYIECIERLGIENEDYSKSKRELIADGLVCERIWKYVFYDDSAELQPEPDNPEDPKAIKVLVDGEHVGYIKKGSCAHVHKLLKNKAIERIGCTIGGGEYKYLAEEYDDEKEKSVYDLEKGETSYFVHLEIYEKTDES